MVDTAIQRDLSEGVSHDGKMEPRPDADQAGLRLNDRVLLVHGKPCRRTHKIQPTVYKRGESAHKTVQLGEIYLVMEPLSETRGIMVRGEVVESAGSIVETVLGNLPEGARPVGDVPCVTHVGRHLLSAKVLDFRSQGGKSSGIEPKEPQAPDAIMMIIGVPDSLKQPACVMYLHRNGQLSSSRSRSKLMTGGRRFATISS